jgi:triphosphoribosyl-dephospho-CoA synthase
MTAAAVRAPAKDASASGLAERLRRIGHTATLALYHELALEPKPGLVSFVDNGSHQDMDARTFMRSLFALRGYFPAIAAAGARGLPMQDLETLGLDSEQRMLAATGGINTHRGAVFALGLLCAAAGRLAASDEAFDAHAVRASLAAGWGAALRERAVRAASRPALTHGQRAARMHGLRSAGDEAADGYPVLFEVTLPALCAARVAGATGDAAMVQGLFATIAHLDDTNLVHRGGMAGLRYAQAQARDFLAAGGVHAAGWRARAAMIHRSFVARRLSPGGAADLLGCAWWVDRLCRPE